MTQIGLDGKDHAVDTNLMPVQKSTPATKPSKPSKADNGTVPTATIISTPRGKFTVGFNSVDEARANGFGLHFEHDGYAIFSKDNSAVAVPLVPSPVEKSTPATKPSKPSKADKATKPTKPAKPSQKPTETPAKVDKAPAKLAKSGKVETTLTPAEKVKRQSKLETITADIRKETTSISSAYMRIGFKLWQVREQKLFLAVDVDSKPLKNVYEYCEMAFGFKRTSAKNFISVCEKFSIKDGKGQPTDEIDPAFLMFGFTQLSEMVSLPAEKLSDVSPEMSMRDIRNLKSGQSTDQSDNDDTDKPEKSRTVCYNGEINTQTWDRLLDKLNSLMGKRIQIIVED